MTTAAMAENVATCHISVWFYDGRIYDHLGLQFGWTRDDTIPNSSTELPTVWLVITMDPV
jgi:hypothetical protein